MESYQKTLLKHERFEKKHELYHRGRSLVPKIILRATTPMHRSAAGQISYKGNTHGVGMHDGPRRAVHKAMNAGTTFGSMKTQRHRMVRLVEGKSREEQEALESKTYENLVTEADIWKLYTDGAFNEYGSRAGLILIDQEGAEYSYVLQLNFANSNNDVEYEALLEGLGIAAKMKVEKIHAFVDSKLVASQVEGSYEAKAVQCEGLTKGVLIKELNEQSVDTAEVNAIGEETTRTWITPIQ
ncbi:reverse transcriptase domain-containing protein [Tanacetum coccineum]